MEINASVILLSIFYKYSKLFTTINYNDQWNRLLNKYTFKVIHSSWLKFYAMIYKLLSSSVKQILFGKVVFLFQFLIFFNKPETKDYYNNYQFFLLHWHQPSLRILLCHTTTPVLILKMHQSYNIIIDYQVSA